MDTRPCRYACLAVLAFAWPIAARADSLCHDNESVNNCRNRVQDEQAKTQTKSAPIDTAKKTETGIAELSGLNSAVKDFVPLLQLTGALGAIQRDDTTGAVSVAFNTRFLTRSGALTQDPALQIKAVIETKPKLFEKIRAALPLDARDALEKRLLATRTDANNFALHASYSFTSKRLGRNFAMHSAIYDTLFEQALAALSSLSGDDTEITRALNDALSAANADFDIEETPWASIPEGTQRTIERLILRGAQVGLSQAAAFRNAVSRSGLDLFGQLVNNQPQLYVTTYRTFRDELYGPAVFSGRVTFEMGLGNNLNAVLSPDEYKACKADPKECLRIYSAKVQDAALRANMKAGSRVTASVEFINSEAYHFASPDPAIDVTIPKGTSWNVSAEYGRLFGVGDAGVADGRVDASVKFEAPPSGAGERRVVAALTITKKLGEFSIPLGVVYANKAKFLTGVDKGLSANVGLKFNLF